MAALEALLPWTCFTRKAATSLKERSGRSELYAVKSGLIEGEEIPRVPHELFVAPLWAQWWHALAGPASVSATCATERSMLYPSPRKKNV
jgi:hypothetical protein